MKRMLKKILNICLPGCFIVIIGFFIFIAVFVAYLTINQKPYEYTNPEDYKIIKKKMAKQDEIKHFPDKIPESAKEIVMFGKTDMPYNGETFILEFKIDKSYIEKELRKYGSENKMYKIGAKREIYFSNSSDNFNATESGRNEPDTKVKNREFFSYSNGIMADEMQNKILYYHIYPAD